MKNIMKLVVAIAFTALSTSASAVSIGTVGSYDILLGSTTLDNSGAAYEEAWVESILLFDIDYDQLSDVDSGAEVWGQTNWLAVEGGVVGDWAFDLSDLNPDYFLVKVGDGEGTGVEQSHYLFSNSESMQWAFLNLDVFGPDVSLYNIGI
ncbi:MAG: hypothetical protein KAT90_02265, partial [Gammaproteobacteria bacterium]|nr:hypothetical protein [Gammaproteobacteria bacterium]